MSEFEGYPLIAGSINGIRSWRVEDDGTLTGVSHHREWTLGENHAECAYYAKPTHRVASDECSCGFYAYLDPSANAYCFSDAPRGIVKAYGAVTVGSRGFRAEKAQIVALVDSRRRVLAALTAAFGLAVLAVLVWVLPDHPHGLWQEIGAVAGGLVSSLITMAALPIFNSGSRVPRKVRRKYPNVRVYRSVRAAVRDWPLVAPEAPLAEAAAEVRERAA